MRRRQYLTATTAVITGIAGCTDVFGSTRNEPEDKSAEYTDWIPSVDGAPTAISADAPAALTEVDDYTLHESVGGRVSGIDVTAVTGRVQIGPYTALSGDFTVNDIEETLDLATDGSYGDYELFTDERGRDFAVRRGRAVVQNFGSDGNENLFEGIIDARQGNGDRLVEANEEFGLLADAISADNRVDIGLTPDVDSWTGIGIGYDVAAGRSAFYSAIVFTRKDQAGELTTDEISDRIEVFFGVDAADIEVSRDGRVVTATGDAVTESI